MTTLNRHRETISVITEERQIVTSSVARKALAVLRIAFGLTFLWAFFDKLLALGFSTGAVVNEQGVKTGIDFFSKDAWIHGGNPTLGFLKFGATGPFQGFYNSIAGEAWVNVLFMAGLLAIGIALTFGIAMRLGTIAGFVLYLMMWTVALWPANNPVIDDHILGALSMVVLGLTLAGETWGAGRIWARTPLVHRFPILR
ncbi:MAG: thiosulfate dehydrogenase (quinone) large subunit [Nocardioidaceae bacterium]|nr:thiosulfate dehydrogenase (quinone) large subunit [Nocardioidaceae bacterium]